MKRIKLFEDFNKELKTNEGQHGSIAIYGKNDDEPKQKLGYAGTVEAAEEIEDEFKDDFDDVWFDDEENT